MSGNVERILEAIRNMPSEIEGIPIPKSLGNNEIGMTVTEFDEAIKYIQEHNLISKVVPTHEDSKIVMIKIP